MTSQDDAASSVNVTGTDQKIDAPVTQPCSPSVLLDEGCFKFLRALASWQHVASTKDLGPQTSQDENRARQKCKRKGLVTYEGGYWRTTDQGRQVIRTVLNAEGIPAFPVRS